MSEKSCGTEFADILNQELELIRLRRRRIWEKMTNSQNDGGDDTSRSLTSSTAAESRSADVIPDKPIIPQVETSAPPDLETGEARFPEAADPDRSSRTSEPDPADLSAPVGGEREDQKLPLDPEKEQRLRALNHHLAGLALSGGGIRSATFALGVLQGLADQKILSRFDYLSTVSGGGYIGGWLAAWMKREGDPLSVEKQLPPNRISQAEPPLGHPDGRAAGRDPLPPRRIVDEEPEPIHHLRSYSNYLTARPGLLSVDTWTLLTIYVRNALINLLLLLPLAMLLVLAGRLVVWFFAIDDQSEVLRSWVFTICTGMFVVAVLSMGFHITYLVYLRKKSRSALRGAAPQRGRPPRRRSEEKTPAGWMIKTLIWTILGPITIAAILACWSFGIRPVKGFPGLPPGTLSSDRFRINLPDSPEFSSLQPNTNHTLFSLQESLPWFHKNTYDLWKDNDFLWARAIDFGILYGLIALLVHLTGFGLWLLLKLLFRLKSRVDDSDGTRRGNPWLYLAMPTAAFVAGFTGGFLFLTMLSSVLWHLHDQPQAIVTLGPPLVLLVIVVATFVEVWLLARWQGDDLREWWARVCSWMVIIGAAWLVFFGITLYGPMLVHTYLGTGWKSGLGLGWLMTAAGGAFAGRSPESKRPGGDWKIKLLVAVAPPVFLIGLLVAVATLVDAAVFTRLDDRIQALGFDPESIRLSVSWVYWNGVATTQIGRIGLVAAASAILALLAIGMSNVNLFSLSSLYANRLTRCYLGASRPKPEWWVRGRAWSRGPGGAPTRARGSARQQNPVTGFDPDDDIPLWKLSIPSEIGTTAEPAYQGPQLIINTSLNLVAGAELAWQDRKAESFILTPNYCGSQGTGYAPTTEKTGSELTLGRAIAISGAAVDSNIGLHQSSALIALMTALNARLGWWIRNPNPATWLWGSRTAPAWDAASPSLALPLLWELFGQTDAKRKWVHLSDGGHFENLGVYELIRRRCRYIVCCDAGTDPGASDDNLATLIRLCRTDFGVRIELDTAQFAREEPGLLSRSHCTVGKIRYDDVDGGELPGVFVYLRTSLTGDEPPDVQEYAAKNTDFPWQSTLDQFFDESQFESYRALGFHVALSTFKEPINVLNAFEPLWSSRDPDIEFKRGNQRLFSAVKRRWAPIPTDQDSKFLQTGHEWAELQEALRDRPNLAPLSRDIYPEPAETSSGLGGADLHAAAQMILIMENTWIGLGFRNNRDLPMNRGWLTVFRRWADTEALRRHWPILRGEYSEDFIAFCESQLALGADRDAARRDELDPMFVDGALRHLGQEFAKEWPKLPPLKTWLDQAEASWNGHFPDQKPIWFLLQAPRDGGKRVRDSRDKIACGIVFARDVSESGKALFEVFVWIRRPYRGAGLASRFVRDVLIQIRDLVWKAGHGKKIPITLRFGYPDRKSISFRIDSEDPMEQKKRYTLDDDLEFVLWRNLLSHYDFRFNDLDDRHPISDQFWNVEKAPPLAYKFWVIEREFDAKYLEKGLPASP